jgi:hypothetical protein
MSLSSLRMIAVLPTRAHDTNKWPARPPAHFGSNSCTLAHFYGAAARGHRVSAAKHTQARRWAWGAGATARPKARSVHKWLCALAETIPRGSQRREAKTAPPSLSFGGGARHRPPESGVVAAVGGGGVPSAGAPLRRLPDGAR